MKKLIAFIFITFPFIIYSQASGSGEFNLTISFEKDIPVSKLNTYCYLKGGNYFLSLNLKVDTETNSITIFGENEYIVLVNFPILFFTYSEIVQVDEKSNQKMEKNNIFYLVNEGIISYNNICKIEFSKEKPNILVKAENIKGVERYNIQTFENSSVDYFFTQNLKVTNEVLKLN